MKLKSSLAVLVLHLALGLSACAGNIEDANVAVDGAQEELASQALPFETIDDPQGLGLAAGRRVNRFIRSAREYQSFFGHAAPASVNFSAGDAVLFYGAGTKRTGGYTASIYSVTKGRASLVVSTMLEVPGAGCFVTQALTSPFALVKVRPGGSVFGARFENHEEAVDCSPCATVRCAAGTHCEEKQVVCVRAPCPPIAECVPDQVPPFCGGFAGIACPGLGDCTDDPTDSCDPSSGGADCGGRCSCDVLAKCHAGEVFDRSPFVCACVPEKP